MWPLPWPRRHLYPHRLRSNQGSLAAATQTTCRLAWHDAHCLHGLPAVPRKPVRFLLGGRCMSKRGQALPRQGVAELAVSTVQSHHRLVARSGGLPDVCVVGLVGRTPTQTSATPPLWESGRRRSCTVVPTNFATLTQIYIDTFERATANRERASRVALLTGCVAREASLKPDVGWWFPKNRGYKGDL